MNGQWIFEEWWQKDERTLQGFRYHYRRGKRRSQQRFCLEERGNDIYYIIIASDTAERVELKMNFSDGQMAIFENLTGTFPKFIRYELDPRKHLHVITEETRADGTEAFVFGKKAVLLGCQFYFAQFRLYEVELYYNGDNLGKRSK